MQHPLVELQTDLPSLPSRSSFIPFRVERPDYDGNCPLPLSRHPAEGNDHSFRPRCLPRKRRHLQPPYLALQTHQPASLLSPNVYAPAQDPYSPPVSPKTIVPLAYPSTSPSALRPCHICHRRPTTRQVLDAYADCDLCAERACFICLRQCDALDCPGATTTYTDKHEPHLPTLNEDLDDAAMGRRKICSSCAVEGITETGAEIVRCLDCVRGTPTASGWILDGMNHDMMRG